jgi:hypothetical protein
MRCTVVLERQMIEEPPMRITLFVGAAATAGLLALIAPAAAMPGAGLGQSAKTSAQSPVEKVEFVRRADGSIYYRRPNWDGQATHYFYYRGYAYPYNPGYTYRLTRGELRPSDRLRRYKLSE